MIPDATKALIRVTARVIRQSADDVREELRAEIAAAEQRIENKFLKQRVAELERANPAETTRGEP